MKMNSVTIGLVFILSFKTCIGMEYLPDTDIGMEHLPDTDIGRNTTELICANGYPSEEYEVQTSDGYFITIQRIPYGRKKENLSNCKRQVVLLVHGLFTDSSSWILNLPEQSLGFVLADHGHDVWLGNGRGNMYSTKHSKFTYDMKDFWNFSFAENGEYDTPAIIDFILNKTAQKQIIVIAISQGTTSTFALLSHLPEYNEKVKLYIALAPVLTLEHSTSRLLKFAPLFKLMSDSLKLTGTYKLPPDSSLKRNLLDGMCSFQFKPLCKKVLFEIIESDSNLNQTRLPIYFSHVLSGASLNSVSHYIQMWESKKFRKYDFGKRKNYFRYNQITPPEYNISRITAPVVLMWSPSDKLTDPRDIHKIEKMLPNVLLSMPYENFSHVDFAVAVNAYKLVYTKILELICNM